MKNKLNLIISFLILMVMLSSSASAFTKSNQHQMPYNVDGIIKYEFSGDSVVIPNARIYVKNLRTNFVVYIKSNENGLFMYDLRNMQVNFPGEYSYMYGDVIEVWTVSSDKRKFQIGSRDLCVQNEGTDCDLKAGSQGGYRIDFNLAPEDFFEYDVPEEEPKTISAGEWFEEHSSGITLAVIVLSILSVAAYIVYQKDKTKYKWLPGMMGILNWRLKNWIKAFNDNSVSDEDVNKLKKTFYKHANTITRKYVRSVESGDIEPEL